VNGAENVEQLSRKPASEDHDIGIHDHP
jgi:hypothetical protein